MATPTRTKPAQGKKPELQVKSLEENISALSLTDLGQVQKLIDEKDWEQAINALNAISAQANRVKHSAARLGDRIVKQHWSPLLQEQQSQ